MAVRVKESGVGKSLSKFYYYFSGLSSQWDYFEIEGEVFAEDEQVVKENITALANYDYDLMDQIEVRIYPLEGEYLWPPDGTEPPVILFDEGPIPSWLDLTSDEPADVPWRTEAKPAPAEDPDEWIDRGSMTSKSMYFTQISDDFSDAVEKTR